MSKPNPFKGFHSGSEIIRLVVKMYTRFPLLLGNVEDLLRERGIDIFSEAVRRGPKTDFVLRRTAVTSLRFQPCRGRLRPG